MAYLKAHVSLFVWTRKTRLESHLCCQILLVQRKGPLYKP